MKLDKAMLSQMLSLPDDKLWQMVQLISAGGGMKLGEKGPSPETMTKLRAVLGEVTDADIDRVLTLIGVYKNAK